MLSASIEVSRVAAGDIHVGMRLAEELTAMPCPPLDPADCVRLADALGDTPETVISVHKLTRGLCRAYVTGDPSHFDGALIEGFDLPEEPAAFGSDAEVLWQLLQSVNGWTCVNAPQAIARELGQVIEERMGVPVRPYGDIYHVLTRPAARFPNDAVRQLAAADLALLESGPWPSPGGGFGGPGPMLAYGIAAGAIVSGQIVCFAQTYARSERHADIGVATIEAWRGRGLATAAASLVARWVQEAGQTPVWSAGEDNAASLRVADKIGFTAVSRRTYLIPRKPE